MPMDQFFFDGKHKLWDFRDKLILLSERGFFDVYMSEHFQENQLRFILLHISPVHFQKIKEKIIDFQSGLDNFKNNNVLEILK
jgi:hypothetical protein